jgi:hypothetical protein
VIVFLLADCYQCRLRYAVAPDPYYPGQWLVFERVNPLERPSHIVVGGLICLKGHTLEVISKEAVMAENGDWLSVEREHPEPSLN